MKNKVNSIDDNQSSDNKSRNSDADSDADSDTDTYININDMLNEEIKNLYQIQINNDKVTIKHIGRSSHVPDIIIKEKFGKKQNLYLYSCIYLEHEIDFLISKIDENKFLPIIKLIEKTGDENEDKVYSLSIKISNLINYNESFNNFTTYLTYSTDSGFVYHIQLDKDINPTNIIEKMFEKIIELGINIL